mmetsp:Transcript_14635/g.34538  ORF Transcript_14635/g.34538 Transcript_14635/m.34538 type:complete len:241 (-) Transcript_14635:993-1715(-)
MITSFASLSSSTVAATSVNLASPSKTMASPWPVLAVPKPPSSTETMSRFMATHMMCVRMAPLLPMSAPTVVSSGWLSMKPSAHRAHPEYELRTVMTTGMSAPPMEAVMCNPRPPERAVIPIRAERPVAGLGFAMKSPMQPSVATPAAAFIWSRMGSLSAPLSRLPLSLPKAMREPAAVTLPMTVASATEVSRTPSSSSGLCALCARKSPTPVKTAARPTSEWKAATVCGREVGSTLEPMP